MVKLKPFIVFSDDWGEHPSSCQHIFKHLVKDHPVIWVNTVGMRLPRFNRADFQKAIKKIKKMFASAEGKTKRLPPNLSVLQPPMIPYNRAIFRKFNKWSVVRKVREEMKKRKIKSPILVTTVPNACDYIGAFGEERVVYYCVDDFANWPGHEKDLILEMEQKLIAKSDIFIATSEELFKKLEKQNKPTYFLPHGVDLDAFLNFSTQTDYEPLQNIPKPRIGYTGLIDDRLDWNLIDYLLKELPDISFVFIGKKEKDFRNLSNKKNFYYINPIPHQEIPAALNSLDILILPYKVNDFTQNINPLKLKEYLASGRPIIGSPLREIEKFYPYVTIARGPEEWVNGIKKLLKKGEISWQERFQILAREDWAFKAREFLEICLNG